MLEHTEIRNFIVVSVTFIYDIEDANCDSLREYSCEIKIY